MLGVGKKFPAFHLTGAVGNDANNAFKDICVTAHERILCQHDVGREAVQSAVRIASVIHAVAGVLEYESARAAQGDRPFSRSARGLSPFSRSEKGGLSPLQTRSQ